MGKHHLPHDWSDGGRMKGGLVCARCGLVRRPSQQEAYHFFINGIWVKERPLCVARGEANAGIAGAERAHR